MPVENSTSFCLSVGNSAILFVMLVWTVADVIAQDTSGSALQLRLLDDDEVDSVEHALGNTYEPIDFSLFRDSIHHWQMKDGRDRNDARYQPEQVVHIAENLLKFQNEDGGWPANLDWLAIIDVQEIRRLRNNTLGRSTFDNRNIYPQIEYLAKVAQVTGLSRYRQAATRGLEYILQEQRATGGWRGRDVDAITFNDDVMVGIMHLLLDIRQNPPHFDWLEPDFKTRLSQALGQAIEVTLMCQIQVDGRKTAWCQQHDHVTFQPVKARTYELPSITALESAGVVRFLMELPNPTPEVIAAIESAIAWFESAKIEGIRIETVPITPVRFEGFTAKIDRREVEDPLAPPIWARFYDIETNRPFFCNRDGIKVEHLTEVKLERRSGYAWYGTWPAKLLDQDYPTWKSRISLEAMHERLKVSE
ncbi:MAG: pectate lyase [Planctomycetaceae bacterium]|nr:pectate lyase [Planctomycetaceae bacterium]